MYMYTKITITATIITITTTKTATIITTAIIITTTIIITIIKLTIIIINSANDFHLYAIIQLYSIIVLVFTERCRFEDNVQPYTCAKNGLLW